MPLKNRTRPSMVASRADQPVRSREDHHDASVEEAEILRPDRRSPAEGAGAAAEDPAAGSVPDRKYFPMITAPSAETPTASKLVPKSTRPDRIWKLGVLAATGVPEQAKTSKATPTMLPTRRIMVVLPTSDGLVGS